MNQFEKIKEVINDEYDTCSGFARDPKEKSYLFNFKEQVLIMLKDKLEDLISCTPLSTCQESKNCPVKLNPKQYVCSLIESCPLYDTTKP